MIHEYLCRCGETFIGDGAETEEHGVRADGAPCGMTGDLIATYVRCVHCGTERETVAILAAMDGIDSAEAICCQDGSLPSR